MSFGAVVAMTLIGCILLGILICNIPILLEPVASLLVPFHMVFQFVDSLCIKLLECL